MNWIRSRLCVSPKRRLVGLPAFVWFALAVLTLVVSLRWHAPPYSAPCFIPTGIVDLVRSGERSEWRPASRPVHSTDQFLEVHIWERFEFLADRSFYWLGIGGPVKKRSIVLEEVRGGRRIMGPFASLPGGPEADITSNMGVRAAVSAAVEQPDLSDRIRHGAVDYQWYSPGVVFGAVSAVRLMSVTMMLLACLRSSIRTTKEVRLLRRRSNLCESCGYPVPPIAATNCPECGGALSPPQSI